MKIVLVNSDVRYLDVTVVMSGIGLSTVDDDTHKLVRIVQVRIVSRKRTRERDLSIGQGRLAAARWLGIFFHDGGGRGGDGIGLGPLDSLGGVGPHVDGPRELEEVVELQGAVCFPVVVKSLQLDDQSLRESPKENMIFL